MGGSIIDDLRYEKEGGVLKRMFGKLKKREAAPEDDLPEISKSIVGRSAPERKVEAPKVNVPELPSLAAIRNLEKTADELKRFDVSRVDDYRNGDKKVEYVSNQPLDERKSVSPIADAESPANRIIEDSKENPDASIYDSSFFSDILEHLNKEGSLISERRSAHSELLSRNLLSEMKENWQGKKEEIREKLNDKEKKDRIIAKINDLSSLEAEWQKKEFAIEGLKNDMAFIETMIDEKSKELKSLIREIRFSESAKNAFFLRDGQSVRSISDLLSAVKAMDGRAFGEHVNELKNDFSEWIMHEFGDGVLAARVKDAYSKEDLIAILEMA